MADIIINPVILNENEIVLYGYRYRIKGQVQVSMSSQYPNKLVIGDYGRNDNPLISTYSVSDLRGGMGLWRYKDTQAQGDRFWTGKNMNTLRSGQITLGPLATSLGNPTTGLGSAILISSLTGILLVLYEGGKVYNHDGTSWSALIDTLPNTTLDWMGKVVFFNNRLFVPMRSIGSQGYSYFTSTAGAATDVASAANVVNGAVDFIVWDNKLYAIDQLGVLYSSLTGDALSWTTLAAIQGYDTSLPAGGVSFPFFKLFTYLNSSGDSTIYCLTSIGLFIYDAVNNKWFAHQFSYPHWNRRYSSGSGGSVWQDSLYIQTDDKVIHKVTQGGASSLVQNVGPFIPDGADTNFRYSVIENVTSTPDFLFATCYQQLNGGIPATQSILLYNGRGWTPIYATNTSSTPGRQVGLLAIRNSQGYRLFWEDTDGTNPLVKWLDISSLLEPPLYSSSITYAASGYVELPVFDAGYDSQQKLALGVRMKLTGTDGTGIVSVFYRLDGSTGSYTNLGGFTTDDEAVLPFGAGSQGIAFKSIQFKLLFIRGATTVLAPKMEYFAMDFMRIPQDIQKGFVVTVDCSEDFDGYTPSEQIVNLWTAIGTTTLGTFSYRDGSTDRSYLVKVMRPQGGEFTGKNERGQYTLFLPEMNLGQ